MPAPLFQPFSPALTTLFGTLDGQTRAGLPVFAGSAGSVGKRKNQNGAEFFVHRYYAGDGSQREQYIGLASESSKDADALAARIAEVKATLAEIRLLLREGFQSADRKTYATLASLQLNGLFAAGATLVGSHAFGAILNHMGVRSAAYVTEDVDVARRETLAFRTVPRKNFLEMLIDSGIDFVDVPPLNRRQGPSSFKERGKSRFHVDLLVPSPDNQIRVVEVPELKVHATALPFLAYLLGQTQLVTLLSREGCCLVRVPVAERFAVHKLIVSQLRTSRDAKVHKDVFQAAVVFAALGDQFPGAIEAGVAALPKSARRFAAKALPATVKLLQEYPRAAGELQEALKQKKVR